MLVIKTKEKTLSLYMRYLKNKFLKNLYSFSTRERAFQCSHSSANASNNWIQNQCNFISTIEDDMKVHQYQFHPFLIHKCNDCHQTYSHFNKVLPASHKCSYKFTKVKEVIDKLFYKDISNLILEYI